MIKYRVYDTQEKKYRDDLYFFIAPNGELLWSYELTDGLCPTDPQRFIIEQYTGLEDKNGVEVASGDIIKRRTANYGKQVFEDEYGVVKYEKGRFYVDFRGDIDNLMLRYGEPEVIGNIHENAELLEM